MDRNTAAAAVRALRIAIEDLAYDLEDVCRAATLHARQHPELQQAADLLNATHDSLTDADDELAHHDHRVDVSNITIATCGCGEHHPTPRRDSDPPDGPPF